MRRTLGVAAALLYVAVAVLLFKGPSFDIDDDGGGAVHVSCGSLIAVGWPSDGSYLDDESSTSWGDHVTGDRSIGTPGRLGIARDCSERRDTYLALIVIAGGAANLLAVGALVTGRRTAGSPMKAF